MSAFGDAAAVSLWASFKTAGMLEVATVTSGGDTFELDVGFVKPNATRFDGSAASTEYEMEYLTEEAPDLAEDDPVTIGGQSFRVREDPHVADANEGIRSTASEGQFSRVKLTAVA